MRKIAVKFGKNLRRIRTGRRMSQGDLSRKLGMDRGYISGLENGKRNPTIATVGKLAEALEVSVIELLK